MGLRTVIDWLLRAWEQVVSWVRFYAEGTRAAGVHPDLTACIIIALLLAVWVGFACLAGSVAGSRLHSVQRHFLLGLAFPVVYPFMLMFTMDIKGLTGPPQPSLSEDDGSELDQGETADRSIIPNDSAETEEDPGATVVVDRVTDASEGPPEPSSPEGEEQVLDMAYFKQAALDDNGNPTGPWLIRCEDREITAEQIADALPHVVILMIRQEGSGIQRLRLPYSRIEGCEYIGD